MDFSVYYYGSTGCGKTETIKLMTGIFEGNENIVSLSSDKETLYKLSCFKETNVMIDDLNKTDSNRIREANEYKVSNILQQKSSSGMIKYKSEDARITSTIFITAEYPLKNHSTINRCIIAEAPEIDMNKLTWLQETQSQYVEFVIDFIEWICNNFTSLTECVRKYIPLCNSDKNIDEHAYSGTKRIMRTELILNVTRMLLMKFFTDDFGIVKNEADSFNEIFKHSINCCISLKISFISSLQSEFLVRKKGKYILNCDLMKIFNFLNFCSNLHN